LLRPVASKLKEVDRLLGGIKRFTKVYAVLGNTDFKSVVEKVRPKNMEILHKKAVHAGGYFLVGYNGHPMYPWEIASPGKKDIFGYSYAETARETNSFPEDRIYKELRKVTSKLPNKKVILVTHTPPYKILDRVVPGLREWAIRSYGETAKKGNVGSTGLRRFVLRYRPLLHVFGHIHESKGARKAGGVVFVNAGKLGGKAEFVEVEIKGGKPKVKFISVR